MHVVVNFSAQGIGTKPVAEQDTEPSSPHRRRTCPLRPFYGFLEYPVSFIMHFQPSPASEARVLQTTTLSPYSPAPFCQFILPFSWAPIEVAMCRKK